MSESGDIQQRYVGQRFSMQEAIELSKKFIENGRTTNGRYYWANAQTGERICGTEYSC